MNKSLDELILRKAEKLRRLKRSMFLTTYLRNNDINISKIFIIRMKKICIDRSLIIQKKNLNHYLNKLENDN